MKTGQLNIAGKHETIVYMLWQGNQLVYIGYTTSWSVRVAFHRRDKDFDHATYFEPSCEHEAYTLEKKLISIYKPKYNVAGGRRPDPGRELDHFLKHGFDHLKEYKGPSSTDEVMEVAKREIRKSNHMDTEVRDETQQE